jgi:hypothetical protein
MLKRMFGLESRLPGWLRPSYRGALFILGMGLGWTGKLLVVLLLATLMLIAGAAPGFVLFFRLLGIAILAGAAAGTIHGVLSPLDAWGHFGAWLRWSLSIFGYTIAIGCLMTSGPFSAGDPALYAFAAGISILGAVCLVLLDDRRLSRPSPPRLRALQGREKLWARADRVRARMASRSQAAGDPGKLATPDGVGEQSPARRRAHLEWLATVRSSTSRVGWWTRK